MYSTATSLSFKKVKNYQRKEKSKNRHLVFTDADIYEETEILNLIRVKKAGSDKHKLSLNPFKQQHR